MLLQARVSLALAFNSGEMNVGNMGSEFGMAYTAMRAAVNLGSRFDG